jgi:hypothetical protein
MSGVIRPPLPFPIDCDFSFGACAGGRAPASRGRAGCPYCYRICLPYIPLLLHPGVLMFRAAFSLAFFGLLRVSEFTCASPNAYCPATELGYADVAFDHPRGILFIFIKVSKADPFRVGATVRVSRTGGPLCPFAAMWEYLAYRGGGAGPLFILLDGQYLTRSRLTSVLRGAFPGAPSGTLGSHSFRIGGASMLCALGVPDATIQLMGRWSSSAFRGYLHLSDGLITRLHRRMSQGAAQQYDAWVPAVLPFP